MFCREKISEIDSTFITFITEADWVGHNGREISEDRRYLIQQACHLIGYSRSVSESRTRNG